MLSTTVYNLKGEKSGKMELLSKVFGVKINPKLIQFVVQAQRANAHVPYAHTKDRSEVSGGGKKPWKQKGTGSARQGSIRSPLWRGGGVTFGPSKLHNTQQKINKKEKKLATAMALSDKLSSELLIVVDSWEGLNGKTKEMFTLLNKLTVKNSSVLIVSGKLDDKLQRASKNLKKSNNTTADSIGVTSLLKYKFLVIDKAGIEVLIK